MKFRVVVVLLSILLSISITQQSATALMTKMPLPELKKKSDSIVRGEVVSMRSAWNEDGTYIWTFVHIKVFERIKDKSNAEEVITVKIPGGTVGDITQSSSDEVTFENGEEVLLFLKKEAHLGKEYFGVVGREQGKFTITDGKIKERGVSADKFIEEIVGK